MDQHLGSYQHRFTCKYPFLLRLNMGHYCSRLTNTLRVYPEDEVSINDGSKYIFLSFDYQRGGCIVEILWCSCNEVLLKADQTVEKYCIYLPLWLSVRLTRSWCIISLLQRWSNWRPLDKHTVLHQTSCRKKPRFHRNTVHRNSRDIFTLYVWQHREVSCLCSAAPSQLLVICWTLHT